ncbi:hypothetical protein BZA77DRAFT_65514 [Pyronema omphalodes]|nr:hypothetical protein BZA77DRAFT_65514 [Pyronema omphalodes]
MVHYSSMPRFDPYANGSRLCIKFMRWGRCSAPQCRENRRLHRFPNKDEIPPLCTEFFTGKCHAAACMFSHEDPKAHSITSTGSKNELRNTNLGSFDHLDPVMPDVNIKELGRCEESSSSKSNGFSQAGPNDNHLSAPTRVEPKEDVSGSIGASVEKSKETEDLGNPECQNSFFHQLELVNTALSSLKDSQDRSHKSSGSIQIDTPESAHSSINLNGRRTLNSFANSTPTTSPDLSTVAQWLDKTSGHGPPEPRRLDDNHSVTESHKSLNLRPEKPKHPPSDAGSDYTQVTSFDEHPTWVKRATPVTRRNLSQSRYNSEASTTPPEPNMVSPPHSQCPRDDEVISADFQPYQHLRIVDMPRTQEWNVLRCFNCWEDGHGVTRCWRPQLGDQEREEKRDELGVINRRWTQYVLASTAFSMEVKKKHKAFTRIWVPYSSKGKYITPFLPNETSTVSTNVGTGIDKSTSTVSPPEQTDRSSQVELLSISAYRRMKRDSSAQTEVVSQNCSTGCQADLQECTTTSSSQTETVKSNDSTAQTSPPKMRSKFVQTPHSFIDCSASEAHPATTNLESVPKKSNSRMRAARKQKEKEVMDSSVEIPEKSENDECDVPVKEKPQKKKRNRAQKKQATEEKKLNQIPEDQTESKPELSDSSKSSAKVVSSLFGGPSNSKEIPSSDTYPAESRSTDVCPSDISETTSSKPGSSSGPSNSVHAQPSSTGKVPVLTPARVHHTALHEPCWRCRKVHGQAEPCDSPNSIVNQSSDDEDWEESRWNGINRSTMEYRAAPRSRRKRYSDPEEETFDISTSRLMKWDTVAYRLEEEGRKEVVFDHRDLNVIPLWMKEAEDMGLPPSQRLKRELEAHGIFDDVPEDEPVHVTQTSSFLRLPVEILESIFKFASNEFSSQRDVKSKDIVAGYEWTCEEAVEDTQRRANELSGVVASCRLFHDVAQQYIYRNIAVDSFQSLKRLTIGLLAKPELAKHVHSLRIAMDQSSISFKSYGRFRYMYESEEKKAPPTLTDFTSAFVLVMEACPNLQVVTCKMWGSALGLGCLEGNWPNLRELCVRDELSLGMVIPGLWNKLSCFPALKKFRLAHADANVCHNFDALQIPGILDTIRPPKFVHLRDICIERAAEVTDESLLRVCSQLQLSRLAVLDCKLVTSGGIANVVQLSKRTLGSLTFWVWKDGQGRPHPNELLPASSHLCATLAKGCRVIGEINLRPYRICEEMWQNCDYKYLGRLHIGMVCFVNCKVKRVSRQIEEQFHEAFGKALEEGRVPRYRKDRCGIRTHEPHFSLGHVPDV